MDSRLQVHDLPVGETKLTLVGTAHVSEESVRLVEEVIREKRPAVVAVAGDHADTGRTGTGAWQRPGGVPLVRGTDDRLVA